MKKFFEFLNSEIDPYGEEDWNNYVSIDSIFNFIWNSIEELNGTIDIDKYEELIKNKFKNIIGKKISFVPYEHRYDQDFTDIIYLKDVDININQYFVVEEINLIDDKNIKHKMSLLRNSEIKVIE